MKFTFIFLFLFGVSLICLVEGNPPGQPIPPQDDGEDDEEIDEEEGEDEDGEEGDEEEEEEENGEEEEEEYPEEEYELEGGAEDYYEDELETQVPTPPPTTTTQLTTTTAKPTTTTTKQTTTTTKSTTTSTTTTVDPRKALEPKVMDLLNRFSTLQTTVNAATVQDQTCKERISSSLVAYLESGRQLESNIYKDVYSKDVIILTTLEGNLKDISKEWTECLVRTTSTTSTSTTTTTEKPTTTTTTTEEPTTTTEEPTTTTKEPTTTVTEEIKLKESIPEFTIDPPKEEYVRDAQDDEIEKQLLDEIKRTEEMIEKQKKAIIIPMVIAHISEEDIPETTAAPTTIATTTQPPTTPKPQVTKTIATTTTVHPNKHMLHPRFKGLKAIRDKPPAICNESMNLYHASRYAKSLCVINQNVSYDEAHEICAREEMDLFAIQSMDHHLVCRHQLHHLFKSVPSFWINGRHINDLWYYFHSENKGQKRFIYPGTQFDGPNTGSCLRLMKFTGHNTIAANAADCDLELPLFCEFYIEQ